MEIRGRRNWLLLFLFFTGIGLFSFSSFHAQALLENDRIPFQYLLINELTGAYSVFVLFPAVLAFARRFPFRRENWYRMLPLHIVASLIFGICHTTLMTLSRTPLYPVFGLKPYEVGDIFYRYLLEYHKQFLAYAAIVATAQTVDYYRANREREKKTAELELRTAQLQSRLTTAQLETLKGQLHPHFLFNTLNMISAVMYEDVKKADRMVARLSTLLRLTLENSESQKVPLRRELEFLQHYVEIMKGRFEDQLDVEVKADPDSMDALVPYLILQPLVENAIKHNDLERAGTVHVVVSAVHTNDRLRLQVSDNGPGLQNPESAFEHGIGVSNTRDRIEQLYPGSGRIEFHTRSGGGLEVCLEIPLESSA